jgi:hypothetical protein
VPHLELHKTLDTYPTSGEGWFRLPTRFLYALPARIAERLPGMRRGIVVSPMSESWLRQHADRCKKRDPR